MELVINIDDKIYEEIKNRNNTCNIYMPHVYASIYAIENGTPLLKGHGRLIDADALEYDIATLESDSDIQFEYIDKQDVVDALTIIEADKS